jgi:hypothetical protein
MVTVADHALEQVQPPVVRRRVVGGLLVLSSLTLGLLGWQLPSPGGSVVVPTLIVFAIGSTSALIWWIVLGNWRMVTAAMAITVVASIWTFQFAVPASVTWLSGATQSASAAIARLSVSRAGDSTVGPEQCSLVQTGSIGPLRAPYRQCTASTPAGSFVTYDAVVGGSHQGIGYTDAGAQTFPDACVRHLTGRWWAFAFTADGTGACRIGYTFQGAP